MAKPDIVFTIDVQHNIFVLNQLIKTASPPEVMHYLKHGYVDDDYSGFTDYKCWLAGTLARIVRKVTT